MRRKVLDHGYVERIESWGSDERIVEAARMSTGKGFLGWGDPVYWECANCRYRCADDIAEWNKTYGMHSNANGVSVNNDGIVYCPNQACLDYTLVRQQPPAGDEKLLRYLYSHKHATPFEMAGMVLEIQAPIFVFREWHRHRTQSYSELSARYTPLPDFNYVPAVDRCLIVNATNKQAGKAAGAEELTHARVLAWLEQLQASYEFSEKVYQQGLAWGIPKEVARLPVPVARYSRMRASANLRNWLAFLTLRMDSAAQWEIRQFANVMGLEIARAFPRTWALFIEGKAYEVLAA